jgi:hypothetical protein
MDHLIWKEAKSIFIPPELHDRAFRWYGRFKDRDLDVIQALRELGDLIPPSRVPVLYRGVHVKGVSPSDQTSVRSLATGVRSWSKSITEPKYYATVGSVLHGIGFIFIWKSPSQILCDGGKANKVFESQGLDPFFDNGEFVAELSSDAQVGEVTPMKSPSKNSTPVYLVTLM